MLKRPFALALATLLALAIGAGFVFAAGLTPTGTGIAVQTNGAVAPAAVNGDSGFVLTSQGTASVPIFAPIPTQFTAGGDLEGGTSAQYVASASGAGVNSATDSGASLSITATEVTVASGTSYRVRVIDGTVSTTDSSTWKTIYTITPSSDQVSAWWVDCVGVDMSVDSGGTGIPNSLHDHVAFNLQFTTEWADGGAMAFVAQGGLSGPAAQVNLTPLNVTGSLDGGAINTTNALGRAGIVDAGADAAAATQMQVQLLGPNSDTYHWSCIAERLERRN